MFKLRSVVFFSVILIALFFLSDKSVSAQVVINEMGVVSSPDWIELYAYEDVDISDWVLDDVGTSSVLYTFPSGTVLGPSSNPLIKVDVSDRLNNSGDTISLYKADKTTLVESVTYGGSSGLCVPENAGGSIGKTSDGGNFMDRYSVSSPNASNSSGTLSPCPSPTPVPSNTPVPTSTPTNAPTNTPTSVPTSTPKPTTAPTKKPTPTPKDYTADNQLLQQSADVANFHYDSESNPTSEEEQNVLAAESSNDLGSISPFAFVLLGLGLIFVGFSVFMFIKNKRGG